MHTLANRQEGRTVSMIAVAATGTLDYSRQANCDAEENEPKSEEGPQSAPRGLYLKRNDQAGHVDQDDCPEYPATIADFFQPLSNDSRIRTFFLSQWRLPSSIAIGVKCCRILMVMNLLDPIKLFNRRGQFMTDASLLLGDNHLIKKFLGYQVNMRADVGDHKFTGGENCLQFFE
jgi:hypothetical protein